MLQSIFNGNNLQIQSNSGESASNTVEIIKDTDVVMCDGDVILSDDLTVICPDLLPGTLPYVGNSCYVIEIAPSTAVGNSFDDVESVISLENAAAECVMTDNEQVTSLRNSVTNVGNSCDAIEIAPVTALGNSLDMGYSNDVNWSTWFIFSDYIYIPQLHDIYVILICCIIISMLVLGDYITKSTYQRTRDAMKHYDGCWWQDWIALAH